MLAAAYVGYLVALGYLVWEPDASTPGGVVVVLARVLHRVGVPGATDVVEVGLNVVLFVPLSLLGAFLLDRWRLSSWLLVGLGLTLVIEGAQRAFLAGRTPSLRDVLANTTGALLGLLLARLLRRVLPARVTDKMSP